MKNRILIFTVALLLQSCYSYKTITSNQTLVERKKYKVVVGHKTVKATFISATDSTSTFKTGKKELQVTSIEIQKIKQRKFSVTKTMSCVSGVLLVTGTIILIDGLSNLNYYKDNGKPLIGP